jgi:membrane protein
VLAGAAFAVVVAVAASALFGVYVSRFGSYGAAWGSLSAVIVMLTWLWLTSLAVLLGSEVEAEARRRATAPAGDPGAG